jgi:hypothetical protein
VEDFMANTTLRLPEEKLKILRAISGYENIPMSKIIEKLVDEYIMAHKETIEIITNKDYYASLCQGIKEAEENDTVSLDKVKRLLNV